MTKPAALFLAAAVSFSGACKPEKPDVVEARRAEAEKTAAEAKKAAEEGSLARLAAPAGLDPETAAQVAAKVGATTITVGDVARYLEALPRTMRARYATQEKKAELLRHMVELELLALAAKEEGLDRHPAVQHALKEALARELLQGVASGVTLEGIGAEDVQRFYHEHSDRYVRSETRRVAKLVVATEEDAKALHAEITGLVAKEPLRAREVFGDFAAERSLDRETKRLRGDTGFFDRSGRNEGGQGIAAGVLAEETWKLAEVNDVSAPFALESKLWALLQLTGKRPAETKPLEEVEAEIRDEILRDRQAAERERFIADLVAKAAVEVDETKLGLVPAPPSEGTAGGAMEGIQRKANAVVGRLPKAQEIGRNLLRRGAPPPVSLDRPNLPVMSPEEMRERIEKERAEMEARRKAKEAAAPAPGGAP